MIKYLNKNFIIVGKTVQLICVDLSGCRENIIQGSGTIKLNDFEGGFYDIFGDDGENYAPINLSSEFKKDSIRIKCTLKILEDQVGIH